MAQFIAYDGLPASGWKNGGGTSTEIAVSPRGAGLEDFDWRVSLATISNSGMFSVYPGVERSLVLVGGKEVMLEIESEQHVRLTAASPLIRFQGEASVFASVAGATIDFNVMTRRGRCRHRVERIDQPSRLTRGSATTLLFVAGGDAVGLRDGERSFLLNRFDALWLGADDARSWSVDAEDGVTLLAVDIDLDLDLDRGLGAGRDISIGGA